MPVPTIGGSLHTVRTAAQGPQHALGTQYVVGASTLDQTLYYVTSAGVVAGGPVYDAAATDVAVILPANMGEQVWIYVFNDSTATLQRGATTKASEVVAATPYHVGVAGAINASEIVGVCQHDLADDEYGWILRKGPGEVLADGSVTAFSAIEPAAAGTVTDAGAVVDSGVGVAMDTDAGASTLVTAILDCRG